ncbi:ribulose-phosphate 3-epimerase [Aliifodinibius sp. S!AR15-10]|uniref:ribulose-phosphate 3-epimerase n=1 Tax=Aliifodinibius sp. S!AR15-10 TaxID=2950437 RepID=UPI002865DB60|nr:ribulose-phosphate 3-epimerase [Aliifodinibius sp. S!AR15-10]MDR8392160.1 ribulose-phosphate 3-epimerase [Aliifodinibius sp. S!AR15-10]
MDIQLPVLAPSILASDYSKLGEQIKECEQGDAKWIHCDIMDGHFVPNISFGPDIVKAVGRVTDLFLDVHLMIENPERYIEHFVDAGADQITVHYEACTHLHRTLQLIKQHGALAGVAVNPATSLQNIEPILDLVDLVLVMSVNPGFGGQDFIPKTYERLEEMAALRSSENYNYLISVDGGVNLDNIDKVSRAGADVLVAGSAVFKAKNIPGRIKELQKKAKAGSKEWV